MAAEARSAIDTAYESAVGAARDVYLTAMQSRAGSVTARDQVASALERYNKTYLALRGAAIESATTR